jgi:hypothetical protein
MAGLYARSDVAHVALSAEGGGCGRGHSRPVIDGAPVRIWRLECPQCAASPILRNDPLWAGTVSEIPETPDETRAREDLELRGSRDRDQIMALALARLAGMPEAADALQTLMSGTPNAAVPHDLGATKECPNGHTASAGTNFCGECGHNFTQTGKAQTGEVHGGINTLTADQVIQFGEPGDAHKMAAPIPAGPYAFPQLTKSDVDGMKVAELREECKRRGLDQHGTKAELAARLTSAGQ